MTSYNVPKTMKALIKRTEVEGYEYTDIPVPEPEGDEVLIKVHATNTDISFYFSFCIYTTTCIRDAKVGKGEIYALETATWTLYYRSLSYMVILSAFTFAILTSRNDG